MIVDYERENSMKARFADYNDIDKLITVRFDYFATENLEITDDLRDMINYQLLQYFEKHLNDDLFAALIEDDNGNVVSSAFLVITEMPANLSWPTGRIGKILNVLTYPSYRKKGYATAAMNLLIEEAKKKDLSYIELSASDLGKPLYKKLGFIEKNSSQFTPMKLTLLK